MGFGCIVAEFGLIRVESGSVALADELRYYTVMLSGRTGRTMQRIHAFEEVFTNPL